MANPYVTDEDLHVSEHSSDEYTITTPKSIVKILTSDGKLDYVSSQFDSPFVWRRLTRVNRISLGARTEQELFVLDKRGDKRSVKAGAMAEFLIAYHAACWIDGALAWLDFPIGDPRNNNTYFQGDDALMHTLSHYWDEIPKMQCNNVYNALKSRLIDYQDRKYTSTQTMFTTMDGTTFSVDILATTYDDVIKTVDYISPDDHVVFGSYLPVKYDPTILHHDILDNALNDYSNNNKARLNRIIESNFSNGLVGPLSYKGMTINIGPGGDGKTTILKLRHYIFGEDCCADVKLHNLADRFALSTAGKARFIESDEVSESVVPSDASTIAKEISTGNLVKAEVKGKQERVPIRGQVIVVNSNHDVKLSQSEATSSAWLRRIVVNQFLHQFDTGDPATSTDDKKFVENLVKDETSLSYLFNLVLDGVRRLIVDQRYTPVPEDDAKARAMLLSVDTVSSYLEVRDVFAMWKYPHLVKIGDKYRDYALVYPHTFDSYKAWEHYDELKKQTKYGEKNYPCGSQSVSAAKFLDERDGELYITLPKNINLVYVGFSNELDILYGDYVALQVEEGKNGKGTLSKRNFTANLKKKGYDSIQIRLQLRGKRGYVAVPTDVHSKSDLDAYTDTLRSDYKATLEKNGDDDYDL